MINLENKNIKITSDSHPNGYSFTGLQKEYIKIQQKGQKYHDDLSADGTFSTRTIDNTVTYRLFFWLSSASELKVFLEYEIGEEFFDLEVRQGQDLILEAVGCFMQDEVLIEREFTVQSANLELHQ